MTQPNENSFYVTLTSSKTHEFPENSPSHFQYRLPQTLWLPGKWKAGLVSLFLPGVSNPIPHVVTSHTSSSLIVHHETKPTKPFWFRSLLHLYKGTNTDIMFQQYAKAFKSSQSQEFLSQLKKQIYPKQAQALNFCPKFFDGWNRI